jgi:purine-binding chemotaxis protein CheW
VLVRLVADEQTPAVSGIRLQDVRRRGPLLRITTPTGVQSRKVGHAHRKERKMWRARRRVRTGERQVDRHMEQGAVAGAGLPARQLLVVEVAGHRCGLPAAAVVEIHAAVQLATLPDAPEVVLGLVNRRGEALVVLDLRRRLGLRTRPMSLDDRLVVLRLPDRHVALQVDAALDVVTVADAALDEAVTAQATRTRGAALLDDGLLVVLDLATFLSQDEAVELEAALLHQARAAS